MLINFAFSFIAPQEMSPAVMYLSAFSGCGTTHILRGLYALDPMGGTLYIRLPASIYITGAAFIIPATAYCLLRKKKGADVNG